LDYPWGVELRSVEAIVKALNDERVRYLVVGGLAVNAHGYARFTADVDLVVGLEPDNLTRGLRALSAIGYQMAIPVTPEDVADPVQRQMWRKDKGMTVLKLWSDVHRRTPVDVFVYEPFDFAEEYGRAKWEPLVGQSKVPFVGYEALLAMKRLAARPQDLADIAALEEIEKLRNRRG
jgi:hypothetical protein